MHIVSVFKIHPTHRFCLQKKTEKKSKHDETQLKTITFAGCTSIYCILLLELCAISPRHFLPTLHSILPLKEISDVKCRSAQKDAHFITQ